VDTTDARDMVGDRDVRNRIVLRVREVDTTDALNMVGDRDVRNRIVLRVREVDTTDARDTVAVYAVPTALIGSIAGLVILNTTVGARPVSKIHSPTIHEAKSHPPTENCWYEDG